MKLRQLLLRASWLAVLATSAAAHASPTFPPLLKKRLELAEVPYGPLGCQLCHSDDKGGPMTTTKPFGQTMFKAGTAGGNPPSMLAALAKVEADGTDSDFDGIPDITELRAGEDPNVPADGATITPHEEIPLPQTGCSLTSPSRPSGWANAASLLVALLLLQRRQKHSPRR